jgi:hypothetical protein
VQGWSQDWHILKKGFLPGVKFVKKYPLQPFGEWWTLLKYLKKNMVIV